MNNITNTVTFMVRSTFTTFSRKPSLRIFLPSHQRSFCIFTHRTNEKSFGNKKLITSKVTISNKRVTRTVSNRNIEHLQFLLKLSEVFLICHIRNPYNLVVWKVISEYFRSTSDVRKLIILNSNNCTIYYSKSYSIVTESVKVLTNIYCMIHWSIS